MKRHIIFQGLLSYITIFILLHFNHGVDAQWNHQPGNRIISEQSVKNGERIFFIRKRNVDGLILGDIYSIKTDGSDLRRLTNFSDRYFVTEQPQISRDGRTMAFISNYESWKSAFYTDAFILDLQTGNFKRVTGYEQNIAATAFGTASVQVLDPKTWAVSPSAIRISYKGCSNFVNDNVAILTIPANEDVWIKAELAKAKGDLKLVRVSPGENVDVKMNLEAGSISAEHAFPSNDGSMMAVALNNENVDFPFYTISIWGTNEANMLAEVAGQRLGGDTHPAFSPDGSMLAFCTGQHTLNSLAIIPAANLNATPTILTYGSGFGIQAFCAQPTWSPDGSEIAFVYTTLVTSFSGTEIQSNVYKVSTMGGDPVQLTSFSGNQVVSRPSFSPDGNSVAFSVLKSFGEVFLLSDLIFNSYSSDIYRVIAIPASNSKRLSKPVALTNDGNSFDPSWGVVNTSVDATKPKACLPSSKLFQNYPNPFHTLTYIEYDIENSGEVKILVYDAFGRTIKVLIDETKAPGRYITSWDGTDFGGKILSGGIYFCKLIANGYSSSRQMVLQR
jgi:Tol biopolymer transport system component